MPRLEGMISYRMIRPYTASHILWLFPYTPAGFQKKRETPLTWLVHADDLEIS